MNTTETPKKITAVSYGGGIQSTALAYLVINRHPELLAVVDALPDCFIFADVGDEPASVYDTVAATKASLEAVGIDLATVKKTTPYGDTLSKDILGRLERGELGLDVPPMFAANLEGEAVPMNRQCTSKWKVKVIHEKLKRRAGLNLRKPSHRARVYVDQWLGISRDEVSRMRDAKETWLKHSYPLVDMKWDRARCVAYLDQVGAVASRSACVYCPFHRNDDWARMKETDPESFLAAVEFERKIHEHFDAGNFKGRFYSRLYLHKSLVPLDQCDFHKQGHLFAFDNECAGVCGV